MIRSGLCHGPDCREEITEKSPSPDFHDDACQARWSAALVGAEPEQLPFWSYVRGGWSFGAVAESVEALRQEFPLGQRVQLTGGEYEVTESEPGRAVLTPIDVARLFGVPPHLLTNDVPKPIRRSWWKPNTWRRS